MKNNLPTESDQEGVLARLQALLGKQRMPVSGRMRVHVIINPAAGKDQPLLKIMNAAFRNAGVDWEVSVTRRAGDAFEIARQAVLDGVDRVLVNGGDGTLREVATALVGSLVPIAVIPGGTANVFATEMGLPFDMAESCALAINPSAKIIKIDMGQVGNEYFLTRTGTGVGTSMVEGADRNFKERLGVLAYALAGLQALSDPPVARYFIKLDGEKEVITEGLMCLVANCGMIGTLGMRMAPNISATDNLLDILVLRKADLSSMLSLAVSIAGSTNPPPDLLHWQVREAEIDSDPQMTVQADGDIIGATPVVARILPQALNVVTPNPPPADLPAESSQEAS